MKPLPSASSRPRRRPRSRIGSCRWCASAPKAKPARHRFNRPSGSKLFVIPSEVEESLSVIVLARSRTIRDVSTSLDMTRPPQTRVLASAALLIMCLTKAAVAANSISTLTDKYLDRYFQMFPTRATAAGRHEFDADLEDFSPAKIAEWIEFNYRYRQSAVDFY